MEDFIKAVQFAFDAIGTADASVIDSANGVQDYAEAPKRIAMGTDLFIKAIKRVYNFIAGLADLPALK